MKKQIRLKVVFFWGAIGLISVIFLVLFGIMIFSITTFDDMDDVRKAKLEISEIIIDNDDQPYYVYIYSGESKKNLEKRQEVEPSVLSYFTFVRKNKGDENVLKIYAFNTDNYTGTVDMRTVNSYFETMSDEMSMSDVPFLIKVEGGTILGVYKTINSLQKELQSAMQK